MKPWIKVLIGVAIGFGAGFGSGFLCHKKMTEMQFEEVTEEEMALLEKDIPKVDNADTESKQIEDINIQELPEDTDELRNKLQGKVSYIKADREAKEKYASVWTTVKTYSSDENADHLPVEEEDTPFDAEEGFDEEFLESLEMEEVEPGQVTPPHPITLGEFYNERPEYDKVTIDYYEQDKTYYDEQEDVITDISSYIGMNADNLFETRVSNDDDPDVRFIRNEQYGTDYEIIRHHNSLREMTEGRN